MTVKNAPTPLKRLVQDIGMNAVTELLAALFPGVIRLMLDGLESVSGVFRILFKVRNKSSELLANALTGAGREGHWSREELINIEINQARCAKMRGLHQPALMHVNAILAIEPNCAEARLLKAQILWEGFGNGEAAKVHLGKLMRLNTNKDDPCYRWARVLYDDLCHLNRPKTGP